MSESRRGYVYVLCFDRPFSHARHYIGCSTDLRGRLRTHARGAGARIVKAAAAVGIGFTLGAVGCCNVATLRRLERQAKDWHGAAGFCVRCAGESVRAIPGTRPYPLEELPFPGASAALAECQSEPTVEVAFAADFDADRLAEMNRSIAATMQAEKHALGWIPAGLDGGIMAMMKRNKVILCLVDGELAGYVAFSERLADFEAVNDPHVTVNQCVVADAVRGCGLGRRMIELLKRNRPGVPLRCKVRDDLEANGFWAAVGFHHAGWETHGTSGARLNCYQHSNEVF